jgi:hypothetical protein
MLGGAATVVLSPATVVLSPATVVLQPRGGAEPSNGGAATTRWCCNHTVVLQPHGGAEPSNGGAEPSLPCLSTLFNTGNQQVCVGLARTINKYIYIYTIHDHIFAHLTMPQHTNQHRESAGMCWVGQNHICLHHTLPYMWQSPCPKY